MWVHPGVIFIFIILNYFILQINIICQVQQQIRTCKQNFNTSIQLNWICWQKPAILFCIIHCYTKFCISKIYTFPLVSLNFFWSAHFLSRVNDSCCSCLKILYSIQQINNHVSVIYYISWTQKYHLGTCLCKFTFLVKECVVLIPWSITSKPYQKSYDYEFINFLRVTLFLPPLDSKTNDGIWCRWLLLWKLFEKLILPIDNPIYYSLVCCSSKPHFKIERVVE